MKNRIMRYTKKNGTPYRGKTFRAWIQAWWKWSSELRKNERPQDHPLNASDLNGKKFERSLLEGGDKPVVALGTQFDKEEGSPSVFGLSMEGCASKYCDRIAFDMSKCGL